MAAGTAAVKGIPAIVNEQASLVHDMKGCEETLEHISSCLDKESERSVSIAYLKETWTSENNIKWKRDKVAGA
jgi:hypothetical protein